MEKQYFGILHLKALLIVQGGFLPKVFAERGYAVPFYKKRPLSHH